ncbi:MAG TPA: STAS domain-containing protein [Rhodanobacteraceae bacterium]|nr:STAS domain-containing protein [Rhodanobacteraceae bacterium]
MTARRPNVPLRIERVDAANVRVAGEIGFANASEGVARTNELLGDKSDVTVDLRDLTRSDSATLGVLLIWAAAAALRRIRLRFTNAPEGLRALAHLCDAEPLLGLA